MPAFISHSDGLIDAHIIDVVMDGITGVVGSASVATQCKVEDQIESEVLFVHPWLRVFRSSMVLINLPST